MNREGPKRRKDDSPATAHLRQPEETNLCPGGNGVICGATLWPPLGTITPYGQPIVPDASSVAILAMADKTGPASGWHFPGIPCLDFGELSRVATIIWSLRD